MLLKFANIISLCSVYSYLYYTLSLFLLQARRRRDEGKAEDDEAQGSPNRESIGTSVEAQTGNSSDVFSIKEESFNEPYKIRRRTRAQVLKIQVERHTL